MLRGTMSILDNKSTHTHFRVRKIFERYQLFFTTLNHFLREHNNIFDDTFAAGNTSEEVGVRSRPFDLAIVLNGCNVVGFAKHRLPREATVSPSFDKHETLSAVSSPTISLWCLFRSSGTLSYGTTRPRAFLKYRITWELFHFSHYALDHRWLALSPEQCPVLADAVTILTFFLPSLRTSPAHFCVRSA